MMSASSREEFEKRQRMIRDSASLDDDDAPMTDASSREGTARNPTFELVPNATQRYELLERPIPQLPADLGLTNLTSSFFKPTAAVLTLTSTFLNTKELSALTR